MFLLCENERASLYWYRGEFWVVPATGTPFTLAIRASETLSPHLCQMNVCRSRTYNVALTQFANQYGAGKIAPRPLLFQNAT